ncbi:MAG: OmpH family outer membrane protein [Ferruginibacter sp.]
MKSQNVSLILNVMLLLAVGILYYLHFSQKKQVVAKSTSATSASTTTSRAPIAYVELDSLNEKITFIKSKRRELEGEQKAIETEWENSYKGLENQKNNFLKKGNAITQEEAQQFQGVLIQQQQQIDTKKQSLTQKLSEKSYKFLEGIQKQLKEFLEEYNKEKNYQYIFTTGTGLDYMVYKDSALNITSDVINGMNEKISRSSKQ